VSLALQSEVVRLGGRSSPLLNSSDVGALTGSKPVPAASWVVERQIMVLASAKQVLHLPQQDKSCTDCKTSPTLYFSSVLLTVKYTLKDLSSRHMDCFCTCFCTPDNL